MHYFTRVTTGLLHRAALACLLLTPVARGAAAPADHMDSLDEVVVEGSRHQLDLIRHEMVLIEDKFNERYNQLNPNHDFDTHCHIESRIGTNTKRRYCRAVYQERAQEREGQDYAEALKNMNAGQPWIPPTPPAVMIEARRKDYQQNIRDVVKKNPELVEMLRQRYELGKRYDATRRKIFGSKAQEEEPEDDKPDPASIGP
ncbi:MAG: hypothetical protein ABI616_01470 [Pseudomonadota bacterium]